MKNLHVLDLRANPFTDLSPLTELDNLEILILDMVPAENPEVLKSLPSLRMLVLSPQNPEQEIVLNELKIKASLFTMNTIRTLMIKTGASRS